MGLHQAIISRTLSFPCDCGETKDHEAKLAFMPDDELETTGEEPVEDDEK